ncbi:hypothetical protein Tco_0802628 [Tanacetum coccineum]|uniref:Uncharacterized protein n=1 Tax=Tanacetum coccineum TaxID=301880 RepID=A0ABQ5A072_9ASTR
METPRSEFQLERMEYCSMYFHQLPASRNTTYEKRGKLRLSCLMAIPKEHMIMIIMELDDANRIGKPSELFAMEHMMERRKRRFSVTQHETGKSKKVIRLGFADNDIGIVNWGEHTCEELKK